MWYSIDKSFDDECVIKCERPKCHWGYLSSSRDDALAHYGLHDERIHGGTDAPLTAEEEEIENGLSLADTVADPAVVRRMINFHKSLPLRGIEHPRGEQKDRWFRT